MTTTDPSDCPGLHLAGFARELALCTCSAQRARAEEAEQERDEARSRLAEATKEIREQGATIAELAAESRPLTPDAITDEARDRAYRAVAALSVSDWDDMSGVAKGRALALVEAVITEITRPEPPARPEGAEEIEELLREMPPGTVTQGAEWLADRGVRVTTEKERDEARARADKAEAEARTQRHRATEYETGDSDERR